MKKCFLLECVVGYYKDGDICSKCSTDESQTTTDIGAVSVDECGM